MVYDQRVINISHISRLVTPLIFFYGFHPFVAMLLVEIISDFIFGLHHYEKYRGEYRYYDKLFDTYSLIISFVIVIKNSIFSKYRILLFCLLFFRIIGVVLYYMNNMKSTIFIFFANFYIGFFYGISLAHYLNDNNNINKYIIIFTILSFMREIWLHKFLTKKH